MDDLYIFLDIDGVLNTDSWTRFVYRHEVKPRMELDPRPVGLMNHMCMELNAKVIISSCWRIGYNTEQLQKIFDSHGCTFKVVGHTGRSSGSRGNEISEYLALHPEVKDYLIIDDETDAGFGHRDDQFVQTISFDGFCIQNYMDAFTKIGWYRDKVLEYHSSEESRVITRNRRQGMYHNKTKPVTTKDHYDE
jgi:hypothetical protein